MEEMIEYFDRAPRHTSATRWKSLVKQLPPPLCDLADVPSLRPLYSKQTMEAALARVQLVGCGERISIFGLLNVCPVSSGYCLGSCNWVSRECRPDVCGTISLLQGKVPKPTVQDIIDLNKLVGHLKQTARTTIKIWSIPPDALIFAETSDASYANASRNGS